jgi:hypothetical protein
MARLKPTAKEILSRSPVDSWEYVRLEPLPWRGTTIQEVLLDRQELTWVPPGHAALLLGGKLEFGETWGKKMLSLLTS